MLAAFQPDSGDASSPPSKLNRAFSESSAKVQRLELTCGQGRMKPSDIKR
ncbi:hypothetical protein WQQ_23730 [Hydrocarboniphaga effusa AP103]|uniref:Uncharacterized protein n=1 Tax=Hydrocarboniphaga effusa AP103 TaxID=1172194 RepID=I8I6A9_9GAMM|nr:hypothetical protein WQQ_23730 [Hydrocarboniphaga effusa AP103]